jgi:hypothetical protein
MSQKGTKAARGVDTGGVRRFPGERDGEGEDDFAEFVRARQHQLLRAAHLVCGDEHAAEVTLDAFAVLALHWRRVKDDSPDTDVRTTLYRAAMAVRHGGPHAVPLLERLTARQRAVTVLLHYEHRSPHEVAEILGLSLGAVRNQARLGDGLDGLLGDVVEPVREIDFVDAARTGAQTRRRRGRRVGAGTAAALVIATGTFAVLPLQATEDRVTPGPAPTSPGRSDSGWNSQALDVSGVRTQVGPLPQQVWRLPEIDDLTRNQLVIPRVLDFPRDVAMPRLSDIGGDSAPVRAVLLRRAPDGFFPVLVRPTIRDGPFVLVDTLPLARNLDADGTSSEPLEVTAVADDRRHVMFLQSGRVLVLDAFSGEVATIPVADRYLESGGWTPGGEDLIVWSRDRIWRLTPATGASARIAAGSYPGRHQVQAQEGSGMRILDFDDRGSGTHSASGPRVLGGVWGPTLTNSTDRVATGAQLDEVAAQQVARARGGSPSRGVFTIDVEQAGPARMLLAPGRPAESRACCEVLGWAFNDQVLIRWSRSQLLAWDVRTGGLSRVSSLPDPPEGSPVGRPGLTVALAP